MDTRTYYEALYSDFFQYIDKKRIYVSDRQKRNLGDAWMEMLHEFVGKLVVKKSKGSSINLIYDEMCDLFPAICSREIQNEDDQLILVFDTLRYVRKLRKQIKEGENVQSKSDIEKCSTG